MQKCNFPAIARFCCPIFKILGYTFHVAKGNN